MSQVGHVAYHIDVHIDVSTRDKQIGTIPSALSPFYQKLKATTNLTSYDLRRTEGEIIGLKLQTGHRERPNTSIC